MFTDLFRTKTFWTGVMGLVGAAGGFLTGAVDPGTALQLGFTSLIGIFLRDGINKL